MMNENYFMRISQNILNYLILIMKAESLSASFPLVD